MIFIMIERFVQLLIEATARVAEPYFLLPVAGKEDPIYRERVYCYELYHQLRLLLENEPALSRYALSGEIDKQGHPLIRQFAPDFVFHAPGQMDDNLVVVEVKPVNAATEGIRKDLETLEYFLSEPIGYKLGVQLVYGDDENALFRFRELHHGAGLPNVQLLWHRHSGQHATLIR